MNERKLKTIFSDELNETIYHLEMNLHLEDNQKELKRPLREISSLRE